MNKVQNLPRIPDYDQIGRYTKQNYGLEPLQHYQEVVEQQQMRFLEQKPQQSFLRKPTEALGAVGLLADPKHPGYYSPERGPAAAEFDRVTAQHGTGQNQFAPQPYYSPPETQQVQQQPFPSMGRTITLRLDFMYHHDLDSKGLFAYLHSKSAMNPAYPGPRQTVKMFCSSIGQGFPESIISPADRADFRTMNQAFSYVGFELLGGRRLAPACYTIRNCLEAENGDSKSECQQTLLNWQFEGSEDMLSWKILDKRVYYPEKHIMRGPPSLAVQGLTKLGAVSTWGLDVERMTEEERLHGFKYFRIVQIGTNYEGGYNLALSALEVYGLTNDAMNWESAPYRT